MYTHICIRMTDTLTRTYNTTCWISNQIHTSTYCSTVVLNSKRELLAEVSHIFGYLPVLHGQMA